MTSALKAFNIDRAESNHATKILLYATIWSLITPCMVGIALSQELNRWPIGEAIFKLWWCGIYRAKASTTSIRYSTEDPKQKIGGEKGVGGSTGLACKTIGSKVDHCGIIHVTTPKGSHCGTCECICVHTKGTPFSTRPCFKSGLNDLNIVP